MAGTSSNAKREIVTQGTRRIAQFFRDESGQSTLRLPQGRTAGLTRSLNLI